MEKEERVEEGGREGRVVEEGGREGVPYFRNMREGLEKGEERKEDMHVCTTHLLPLLVSPERVCRFW